MRSRREKGGSLIKLWLENNEAFAQFPLGMVKAVLLAEETLQALGSRAARYSRGSALCARSPGPRSSISVAKICTRPCLSIGCPSIPMYPATITGLSTSRENPRSSHHAKNSRTARPYETRVLGLRMLAVKNSMNQNDGRSPAAEMIAGRPANPRAPSSCCFLVMFPPPSTLVWLQSMSHSVLYDA